jgi:hypothetical protein
MENVATAATEPAGIDAAIGDAVRTLVDRSGEPAVVSQILDELAQSHVLVLSRSSAKGASSALSRRLHTLLGRGAVASAGKEGRNRLYVPPGHPLVAPDADVSSDRERLIAAVRLAFEHEDRAVRLEDVMAALDDDGPKRLSRHQVSGYLSRIAKEGAIQRVGTLPGRPHGGGRLYLPAGVDPHGLFPDGPLTFRGVVLAALRREWARRSEAEGDGEVAALSTREVALLVPPRDDEAGSVHLASVTNALRILARGNAPRVRAVPGPSQLAFWAPAEIPEADVCLAPEAMNDSDRVFIAARRALRPDRPAVRLRAIRAKIDADPGLALQGAASIASTVWGITRRSSTGGSRRDDGRLVIAGRVASRRYYTTPERLPAAKAYIQYRTARWHDHRLEVERRAVEVPECIVDRIREARLVLLREDIVSLAAEYEAARDLPDLPDRWRTRASERAEELRELAGEGLEVPFRRVPVRRVPDVFRPDEAQALFGALAPALWERVGPDQFSSFFADVLRHLNGEHTFSFAKESAARVRWLLDRADYLMHLAREVGGVRCSSAGGAAHFHLGMLRDPSPLLTALDEGELDERLAAVDCLAFLTGSGMHERLRQAVRHDPEPGVRTNALWALGFAGGEAMDELLEAVARTDPSPMVREFARRMLEMRADPHRWWRA